MTYAVVGPLTWTANSLKVQMALLGSSRRLNLNDGQEIDVA